MREKYVHFTVGLKKSQVKFLRERSVRTGDRDMAAFIREAIDVAIKKEMTQMSKY